MSRKLCFVCDKKWEELKEIGQEGIRYCDSCDRNVFLIKNEEEFEENRELGRCVAFGEGYEFMNETERVEMNLVMGWPDGQPRRLLKNLEKNKK